MIESLAPIATAGAGALAPFFAGGYTKLAREALERGAVLLAPPALAAKLATTAATANVWSHPHADWVLAELLATVTDEEHPPVVGPDTVIGPNVVLYPGVVVGARVRIEAGAVIGSPGFGWATSPDGRVVAIPQRAGVILESDVRIGANCTVDAGTLAPTRIRKGAKLDAQVHVGHNVDIGEGTLVAAQSGFAGSVVIGKGVRIGGQVGIANHVHVGDGAQIAAKSGVIGDVPAGAVVAGYPAVSRTRWLRGLATLYRLSSSRRAP